MRELPLPLAIVTCLALVPSPFALGRESPAQWSAPQSTSVAGMAVSDQLFRFRAQLRSKWARRAALGHIPATITEPQVTAGQVLTSSVDVTKAPGVPELQLTISAGTVGVSSILITLASPSGTRFFTTFVSQPTYPAEPKHESLDALLEPYVGGGLSLYSQPGDWSISGLSLIANDGSLVTYSPTQIAALFNNAATVNVINPNTADVTPPMFGKGVILTPTVSMSSSSPLVAVRLPVDDDISGVSSASLSLSGPPDANGFQSDIYISAQITAPVLKKTVILSSELSPGQTLGTYTVNSISLCDFAGNCSFVQMPDLSSHFSNPTVTVTN